MKKLFTLLTLALLSIGSAWASTVDDLTSITSATTITMDGINGTSALVDKTLYADGKLLCLGGCGYSTAKGSTTYNEVVYKNVYQIKSNRQIALKIGFKATITIVGQSHSSRTWRLGTKSAGNEIAESPASSTTLTANVDGSSEEQTVYINATSDLYLGAIIITANESTSPVISATSPVSIKATKSGVEVTQDIIVTGENLTGSTLTATISPVVTGMSVTLGSSTITDGEISTTATLHYNVTANANGATTLTLSDGTTSKDVTVNYKALVVPTELAAISTETTFDLSKVGTSGLDAITVDDGWVVLKDAGSEVSFADNLAVAGISGVNVTWRADAIQAPLFKFKTTVPGTVTVKFSDVGNSSGRANRYANVNGVRSDVYSTTSASAGVKTCAPIAVSAGEVIIKGQVQGDGDSYTDNQIRVFTITFTPLTGGDAVTISSYEWATCVPSADIDFTGTGVNAYIVTSHSEKALVMTQVNKVEAGTPLLINASTGSYEIPALVGAADATTGNLLKAGTGAAVSAEANKTKYALSAEAGVAVFKKIATSATIPAGKAYLEFNEEISAPSLSFDFGGTTGIDEVRGQMEDVRGEYYNLAGQRVAQPTKGLYIVNGKKVILK